MALDEAEQKFREALAHGDHPIIHLYLSQALEKQSRLVEAYAALRQALRPGVEPLPPKDAQVAKKLQKSLESQLAQIEVHCDVPGAEISLDDETWFTAPDRQHRMMSAGRHVLIARRPGYFPVTEPVSLIPGKQTRVVLRMTADVIHVERRSFKLKSYLLTDSACCMFVRQCILYVKTARTASACCTSVAVSNDLLGYCMISLKTIHAIVPPCGHRQRFPYGGNDEHRICRPSAGDQIAAGRSTRSKRFVAC